MKDLETIYENMLNPLILRVIKQPFPLEPVEAIDNNKDEDVKEYEEEQCEEVEIARDILSIVSELDDLAKEAMYKSYRNKIESCSDRIRNLANKLIEENDEEV